MFALSILFLILSFLFSLLFSYERNKTDKYLTEKISEQANYASSEISSLFENIKFATAEIEKRITQEKLNDSQIREIIKDVVENTDGAHRGGVVFKKNRFNESHSLYSPFYQKLINNSPTQQISDNYDYTIPDVIFLQDNNNNDSKTKSPRTFWFHEPLKKGAMWLPPYYGTTAKNWLSEYIRPFISDYDGDYSNGFDGIIFMNFSLSGLSEITSELKLENSGYAFILTNDDVLISYPDSQFLGKPLQQIQEDEIIQTLISQRHEASMTRFIHPINKKECWLIFKPIKGSQFSLGILVWAEEIRSKFNINTIFPYDDISLICQITALVFLIGSLIFPYGKRRIYYKLSWMLSFILLASLLIICFDKLNRDISQQSKNQVYESVNVSNLLLKQSQNGAFEIDRIPIQLTLNSLSFSDPSTIALIGKIKLENVNTKLQEPPVYFPMALQTRWEKVDKNQEVWKFTASIKQPFNYTSFPFDKEEINLRIRLKNEYKSAILIPDFNFYDDMSPYALPGINLDQVRLNGWTLNKSYFSYLTQNNTLSELSFNLVIKRNLIGPFITYLFPLLMILSLAYFTLLMWTRESKQLSLWGFSFSSVLARSSSLFFILILSHISLRDALEAKGIIFLEFYYLASYSLLICVTISSMLYLSNSKSYLINYQDGLLLKVLYWPYFLLFCIVTTLIQL